MENVKKFYEALAGDKAMQERAKKLSDPKPGEEKAALDTIVGFAAEEGFAFTADELKGFAEEKNKELNDDEVEAVAGGSTEYLLELELRSKRFGTF